MLTTGASAATPGQCVPVLEGYDLYNCEPRTGASGAKPYGVNCLAFDSSGGFQAIQACATGLCADDHDDDGYCEQCHELAFGQAAQVPVCTAQAAAAATEAAEAAEAAAAAAAGSTGVATARKDPHIHFADGGRADFRGQHNKIFNFLSARNVSVNIKTVASDFKWTRGTITDMAPPRLIHGTRMDAAYWHIRTTANRRVLVTYDTTAPASAKLETSAFRAGQPSDCQLKFLSEQRACRQSLTTWTAVTLQAGDDVEIDK